MNIEINSIKYKIIKDDDNTCDVELLKEMLTDYFNDYDYIVGDWAYSKLRLKGFTKKNNKINNKINDYENIDGYIKSNCAYGCKYFIIEKLVEN